MKNTQIKAFLELAVRWKKYADVFEDYIEK